MTDHFDLGSFKYPYLMAGMGDGGGEVRYWFAITEWEYVLLVGVSLDGDESDEYAIDIASFVFKDRVPISRSEHEAKYTEIAGELLLAHFAHFIGNDDIHEFKSFVAESNSRSLISVLDYYEKNAELEIKQTIFEDNMTDEEKKMFDNMNGSKINND